MVPQANGYPRHPRKTPTKKAADTGGPAVRRVILTRARKAAQKREHAGKAAACQDLKTAIRQFQEAERKCLPSQPFLTVYGVCKFAKEMMRTFYQGAKYEVMLFECKRRGYVTFCFGQIPSVIKTFDTIDEVLASVGSVLNEALYKMMANGDAMYRLPNKAVLWYPMEGGEEETFYRAEVPVDLDSPATLQRSDLVPYTPGPADGSA